MKIAKILSEIFCPSGIKCIACGDEVFVDDSYSLCPKCALPKNENFCHSCGRGIPDMAEFCDYCKERACDFTAARAPYIFEGSTQQIIHKLKYGGAKYIAEILATMMADSFYRYGWKIDEVTFVPMHEKRQKRRGYNQTELIATHFCRLTGLELVPHLVRTRFTENLARMSREQREAAIKDSIAKKTQAKCKKSVLLIDDVFTTGTTSGECAKLLKKNGAVAVYVLTLATAQIKPILY